MSGQSHLFSSLGFVQFSIELAEPEKNLDQVRAGLQSLDHPDGSLIVLPELWSCGFAYGQLEAMAVDTESVLQRLIGLARRYNCVLAGSLPERMTAGRQARLYNTLYIVGAEGLYGAYRKQQIFAYGGEMKTFAAGSEPRPIVTPRGRIGGLVCYDLRFPLLARSQCQQGADLLVCPAEWPSVRIEQWRTLLRARAIENQTFVVACNGCGMVDGVELGGYSAVIDPQGNVLAEAAASPQAMIVQVDWQVRDAFRSRFNSFAPAPYSFADEGKICASVGDCLELISRRKKIGQKTVYWVLDGDIGSEIEIKTLQDTRRQGDFLLVGVLPGGEKSLRAIAALGCVDAVCSLQDFSADDLERLPELLAS